ncbi:MAG: hypothetical protein K9L02_00580 [Acholeplasmataceae bacterium]|nr:hypothetical protein [Acholeplasmataceae bacterium]
MKYKIIIKNSKNKVVFSGKPIALPIKEKAIIEKSIELFSDPEPCIIHQSYASQKLVDEFMTLFPILPLSEFGLVDYKHKLDFIKIPDIEKCFLSIEVKK